MDFWTPQRFAELTQGRWLIAPTVAALTTGGASAGSAPRALRSVTIDSRTISRDKAGAVFIAVAGERFDGHDFIAAAIDAGAAMVIVERDDVLAQLRRPDGSFDDRAPLLCVDNCVAAMQRLAAAWRDELETHGVKVIAVTGSNGKTTTRNMIHSLLSRPPVALRGTQSPKSFNNHLGVPLTLLAASRDDDFVIVEVGTNHPGEIAALSRIVRPDIAVITTIGHAHIGHFDGEAGIVKEKAAMLDYVREDGVSIVHEDAWEKIQVGPASRRSQKIQVGPASRRSQKIQVGPASRRSHPANAMDDGLDDGRDGRPTARDGRPTCKPIRLVRFGRDATCGVFATDITSTLDGVRFSLNARTPAMLPMLGEHNVDNALAAVAAAMRLGFTEADAAAGLALVAPVPMRMRLQRFGDDDCGVTIINDAYNASPDSMRAALETLVSLPRPNRRVVILGDMLELGGATQREHERIGAWLAQHADAIDAAIFIGEQMQHALGAFGAIAFPQWSDDLPARIAALLEPGDLALLKASRGLAFERLIPAIEQRFQRARETVGV